MYDSTSWSLMTGDGTADITNRTGLNKLYNSMVLKDTVNTYYKFGVFKSDADNFSGNSTTITNLTSSMTIFKVFLNNETITDYTVSGSTITFNSGYKTFNNYCTVIFYPTAQTITGTVTLYYKSARKSLMSNNEYYDGLPFTTNSDIYSGSLSASSYYYVKNTGKGFIYSGTTYTTGSIVYSGAGGSPTWNEATLVLLPTIAVSGGNSYEITLTGAVNTTLNIGEYVKIGNTITTIIDKVSTNKIYVNDSVSTPNPPVLRILTGLGFVSNEDDLQITNNDEYYEFGDAKGIKKPFRKQTKQRKSITFSQWVEENYTSSLYNYPVISRAFNEYIGKNDLFRIVMIDRVNNKMEILTNATIYDNSSASKNADGNKVVTNVVFEDEITVVDKSVTYGNGGYGVGYYGGYRIFRS